MADNKNAGWEVGDEDVGDTHKYWLEQVRPCKTRDG